MTEELQLKISALPDSPGCYLMKSRGEIIYVGKAKNLKLRVRNTAGTEFSYMSQYNGSGIAVSEDNGDGSITVTLPETDAWSAVTVFIK